MNSSTLAKFTVTLSDDTADAALGDNLLDVIDTEGEKVSAECEFAALATATLTDFPDELEVRVHSSDGFGTFLFHEIDIYKGNAKVVHLTVDAAKRVFMPRAATSANWNAVLRRSI